MKATLFGMTLIVLFTASCSNRGVYEGIQVSNRSSCYNLPANQRQQCLEELRAIDYDEYQRELEKIKNTK